MLKISLATLFVAIIPLTGCGGSGIYIEEIAYDDYGYLGDELAGRSYSATHIELGIGSGNFYELDPQSLQLSFDSTASSVLGSKNCNAFAAESTWFEFGLVLRFINHENHYCPIELIGFPENVYINDIFEIESYYELGRQVVVLYSDSQDVSIHLN